MEEKFIILVGDGMGDYPIDELAGRTPLEAASTPNMDKLAQIGRMGTVRTIPHGMEPGSDVANMSLLGYDPAIYHTGRGPLEAASMGVCLKPDEVAFRCNLIWLRHEANGATFMGDYSAGHISTAEAHDIVSSLQDAVAGLPLDLYPGVSYRHLLVWSGGHESLNTTPPHDITGRDIASFNCISEQPTLNSFVSRAAELLREHPVNRSRELAGKTPANAVWLWGQGKAPLMPKLDAFGISGAMISAVDLLKGIGIYAGLTAVSVPGATGYLDTNYEGKVAAAISAIETGNFVFLHIEAPDEASHEGSLRKKIEAIELFDMRIVGPIIEGAMKFPKVRVLVCPDHFTPISRRTHSLDPVPFLLVEDLKAPGGSNGVQTKYCEREAQAAAWHLESGPDLFRAFLGRCGSKPEGSGRIG